MRKILLLFFLGLWVIQAYSQPIVRHALLVGIGQYPKNSKWPLLHADQDALRLKNELKKNGFLEGNIRLLRNEEATYENIRLAFKKLTDAAGPEDQVVVYLGGHSQKITDFSNDEADALDEAFIPYDAGPIHTLGGYNGESHLTDDELAKWINLLTKRVTRFGSIFFLYDGGISGQKTTQKFVRGTFPPFIAQSRFTLADQPNRQKPDNEWLDVTFSENNSGLVCLDPGMSPGIISEIQYQPNRWGSPLADLYVSFLGFAGKSKRYRDLVDLAIPLYQKHKIPSHYRLDGDINQEFSKSIQKLSASGEPEEVIESDSGQVYSIIIGVSNYLRIGKLQYGHEDARYFADVLQKSFKEKLPLENQFIFIDSNATSNPIYEALENLSQRVKANDKIYFYFAGHGDVENLITRRAHLLLFDSPPNVYKAGGTLPVDGLKDYLVEWTYKKARVFLVIDACKSGNLAGGIEGQSVAINTIKGLDVQSARILSCQPNEKSLESTEYGGGHGAFTYYLVKGIRGEANTNHDTYISVGEIGTFLGDSVPARTQQSQNPLVEGNKRARFLPVAGESIRSDLSSPIVAKNRASFSIPEEDSLKARWVRELRMELAAGRLLKPDHQCARKTMDRISQKWPMDIRFLQSVRQELASTLVLKSQKLINAYIEGNESVAHEELFKEGAREMDYLLELIDLENPLYFTYLARKYFFEGRSILPALVTNDLNRNQLKAAVRNLESSLKYEPEGAQNYNALGRLYQANRQYEEAISSYRKAIRLAPRWKFPIQNLGTAYDEYATSRMEPALYDSAISFFNRSISIDPSYALAFTNLGRTYSNKGNSGEAKKYYLRALFLNSSRPEGYLYLGEIYCNEEKWDSARYYLQQGLLIHPDNPDLQTNMGNVYYNQMQSETDSFVKVRDASLAKLFYHKATILDSLNEYATVGLGNVFWEESKLDSALFFYKKCVALDSLNIDYHVFVMEVQIRTGKAREAEQKANRLLKTFSKGEAAGKLWYELGVISAVNKDFQKAFQQFQKAISFGFTDPDSYNMEPLLEAFRKSALFSELKKKLKE